MTLWYDIKKVLGDRNYGDDKIFSSCVFVFIDLSVFNRQE